MREGDRDFDWTEECKPVHCFTVPKQTEFALTPLSNNFMPQRETPHSVNSDVKEWDPTPKQQLSAISSNNIIEDKFKPIGIPSFN